MSEDRSAEDPAALWPQVRQVDALAPWRWLRAGWSDFRQRPLASLFYGIVLAAMGLLLVRQVGSGALALGLVTGFLLVGPFLATGLYAISRACERGERIAFRQSLVAWRSNLGGYGFYAALLALLLAVWLRVSVVVVALFFEGGMPHLGTLLRDLWQAPNGGAFLSVYLAAGAGFALFVYALTAVSLPLLMDRPRLDALTAGIASLRAVVANPVPALIWALLIVVLTAIGFLSAGLGLILALPLIGHASWHAYRDLLEPV